MRKYEIMYILRADLDEAARKTSMDKLADLLTKNGAKIDNVNESMGLREFAYPINGFPKFIFRVSEPGNSPIFCC